MRTANQSEKDVENTSQLILPSPAQSIVFAAILIPNWPAFVARSRSRRSSHRLFEIEDLGAFILSFLPFAAFRQVTQSTKQLLAYRNLEKYVKEDAQRLENQAFVLLRGITKYQPKSTGDSYYHVNARVSAYVAGTGRFLRTLPIKKQTELLQSDLNDRTDLNDRSGFGTVSIIAGGVIVFCGLAAGGAVLAPMLGGMAAVGIMLAIISLIYASCFLAGQLIPGKHEFEVRLSRNNRLLAVRSDSSDKLTILEKRSGKILMTLGLTKQSVWAFSPNQKFLAVSESNVVRIYEIASGKILQILSDTTMYQCNFSPNDKFLAVLESNSVNVYELASGKKIRTLVFDPAVISDHDDVQKLYLDSTSDRLGIVLKNDANEVMIWDTRTGKFQGAVPHKENIQNIVGIANIMHNGTIDYFDNVPDNDSNDMSVPDILKNALKQYQSETSGVFGFFCTRQSKKSLDAFTRLAKLADSDKTTLAEINHVLSEVQLDPLSSRLGRILNEYDLIDHLGKPLVVMASDAADSREERSETSLSYGTCTN